MQGKLALALGVIALSMLTAPALAQEGRRGGEGRGMLQQADANGDGQITAAEITAARAEAFRRADANGDGQLAGTELRRRMGQADSNQDGVVTRAEFMDRPFPIMQRFDANGDQVLDAAELQAAQAAHREHGGRRGGAGG